MRSGAKTFALRSADHQPCFTISCSSIRKVLAVSAGGNAVRLPWCGGIITSLSKWYGGRAANKPELYPHLDCPASIPKRGLRHVQLEADPRTQLQTAAQRDVPAVRSGGSDFVPRPEGGRFQFDPRFGLRGPSQ